MYVDTFLKCIFFFIHKLYICSVPWFIYSQNDWSFKSLWKPLFLGNAEDFCVCSFAEENADECMIEKVKYNVKYVLCIINWLKNVFA